MALSIGQVLENRYRIVGLLGQGGMGAVYRAWDKNLSVAVALKENLDLSGESRSQFEHEALLLAQLTHPNLPRVTNHFFVPGQGQYLVMDFIDGEDLQQRLDRSGRLTETEALPIMQQILPALAYLHNRPEPIIHRDIKPANIKIDSSGRAVLVDFGIAKRYMPQHKTTRGAQAITPGFSPPEQYGLGSTDARSDIYATGATLYALLTGDTPVESVSRLAGAILPPPTGLRPHMVRAIQRAMEMDPYNRFQKAEEFAAALTSSIVASSPLYPSRRQHKRSLKWVIVLTAVVLTTVGVWLLPSISFPDFRVLIAGGAILLLVALIWLFVQLRDRQQGARVPSSIRSEDKVREPDSSLFTGNMSQPAPTGSTQHTSRRPKTRKIKESVLVTKRRGQVIDSLILHESYDRLRDFINDSSGGRFVLTGYGRFGATSLIKGAMSQAQRYLLERGKDKGTLIVFYSEVVSEDLSNQTVQFKVALNEARVGSFQVDTHSLSDHGMHHARKSRMRRSPSNDSDELLRMLRSSMTSTGKTGVPARAVLVLDRIQYIDTLEMLSRNGLFEGDDLSVIAVARKEDADRWKNAKRRMRAIGFQDWYIPCLWHSEQQLRTALKGALFPEGLDESATEDEKMLENVLKHFEYLGRGILGDTLDAIKHGDNWYSEGDEKLFAVESIWRRPSTQRNCWLQELLDLNWSFILGDSLIDPEPIDRARIGVYHLLDSMLEAGTFVVTQLQELAEGAQIPISHNAVIRDMMVENLVYALEHNRFLKRSDDGTFRVSWRPGRAAAHRVSRRDPKWKLPEVPKSAQAIVPEQTTSYDPTQQVSESALHSALASYFNVSELEELASTLGINPEEIKGETISAKALDLIGYLKRRNRLLDLADAVRKARPGQL